MQAYVGVTDEEWFKPLASRPGLEEANFWQPSGSRGFKALQPGEPFLFKLHSPNNFIVGGGFFAHSTLLPVSLAWESFGIANGAATLNDGEEEQSRKRGGGASAEPAGMDPERSLRRGPDRRGG